MYLQNLEIVNNGRLERIRLQARFTDDGKPLPIVVVGENGSGKTNLLAIIADAIFEASVHAYDDALPAQGVSSRAFFRLTGGRITSYGKRGYSSFLKFKQDSFELSFVENYGELTEEERSYISEEGLAAVAALAGNSKSFNLNGADATSIFKNSIFAFFPTSRSEVPYWMNEGVQDSPSFAIFERFNKRVENQLYLESSLRDFTQWMLSVLIDSRGDVIWLPGQSGDPVSLVPVISGSAPRIAGGQAIWLAANRVLQLILDDDDARFVWLGREHPNKIGIQSGSDIKAIGLKALSGGQSSLLSIFGTILRFADSRVGDGANVNNVRGICIIDEIDSHMHVSLQTRAIPSLMALFPNIQFVVSGHSPLFLMGLEKSYPNIDFLELPLGRFVPAEEYKEFRSAFEAFQATEAFSKEVAQSASNQTGPVVLLAGETDPIYFKTACEALGFSQFDGKDIFRWIGSVDSKGQGYFTGDESLKKGAQMMRANPEMAQFRTLFLFDCDAPQADVDEGNIHIRTITRNDANSKVKIGIENLLPESVFATHHYDSKTKIRNDGGESSISQLNKMKLCQELCANPDPVVFKYFRPEIERVLMILGL